MPFANIVGGGRVRGGKVWCGWCLGGHPRAPLSFIKLIGETLSKVSVAA